MSDTHTYHLQLRGPVDEADLNASSPLQITLEAVTANCASLRVQTDQSGIIGLVRHLHDRGLTILSTSCDEVAPAPASWQLSRRQFLRTSGIVGATALVTLGSATILAPDPEPIYPAMFTFGGNTMTQHILIAYATATGSTIDVAATIGETLSKSSFQVDVKPIQARPTLDTYDAVVIGSAVQFGNWLPEAIQFVKDNQPALNRLPVALFCVHIQNTGNDVGSRQKRLAYLDAVRPYAQAVDEAFFAGRFNRQGGKLLLPGWLGNLVPTLDRRNWDKIRAWAESLVFYLR